MGTISISGLGKAYKVYGSRWSRLREWLLPWRGQRHELKWVLQDVNFTVRPGESLGIIGINGAGKSTLLKLITGTTRPTTGNVSMTGRVAAMLELGMGFHPDFTGRQNAYMACQLLGISSQTIDGLMPDIEAFAEIGTYLDQPVRVYSSGMQMRLAFSVATAVRPDILIIDEALSVGDAYFQHKSFDRIREFQALGTTLLIVSHDKQAIQSICDRAILLNDGRLAYEGKPEAVMDYYNAMLANRQEQSLQQVVQADGHVQTVSGTGDATIRNIQLTRMDGAHLESIPVGMRVTLKVYAVTHVPLRSLVIGFMIKDRLGQSIFGTNTRHLGAELKEIDGNCSVEATFEFLANLGPGDYSIAIALHSDGTHMDGNYEWRDQALRFNVINVSHPEFSGVTWIPCEVKVHCE